MREPSALPAGRPGEPLSLHGKVLGFCLLPPPVEAEEIEVFQAGVEYTEMTVNTGMTEGVGPGGGGPASPPDTACPLAALHLEEGFLPGPRSDHGQRCLPAESHSPGARL